MSNRDLATGLPVIEPDVTTAELHAALRVLARIHTCDKFGPGFYVRSIPSLVFIASDEEISEAWRVVRRTLRLSV